MCSSEKLATYFPGVLLIRQLDIQISPPSWEICVLMILGIATVHPWNINPLGPHEELIMAGPCDHGQGQGENGTPMLESTREYYHQVCHSSTVSRAVVGILGLAKCWFWRVYNEMSGAKYNILHWSNWKTTLSWILKCSIWTLMDDLICV